MLLTDEQLEDRLASPLNLKNILHKITGKGQHKTQSRGFKNTGLKNEDRALIALTAQFDTVDNTAKAFNISPASVSAYKSGVTSLNPDSRSGKNSQELKELINNKANKISETALDRLVEALDEVDVKDPKKALLLTTVSKNLADIHDKVKIGGKDGTGVKVTIFSPNQKHINDYEVIEVNMEN
jgi:predicted transcriptional regulator